MAGTFTSVPLTNTFDLGKDGELTVGTVKMGGIENVSVSIEATTIDLSTRDDEGWTNEAAGPRSATIDVQYFKNGADVAQEGLRDLFFSDEYDSKGFEVICTSGKSGKGISGIFKITSMSETQNLQEGTACSITLKNCGKVTRVSGSGAASQTSSYNTIDSYEE